MSVEGVLVAVAGFALGLQNLFAFAESSEVDWSAGVPLAMGSAAGAYVAAARLITRERARVRVYRFLVLVVVLSIIQLLVVDSANYLQHT